MPTTNMARVESVLTGVPGSPYYSRAYFDALAGTPDDMIAAWHNFVTVGGGGSSVSLPTGAVVTTGGTLEVVNPVSGEVEGVLLGSTSVTTGTGTQDLAPTATQILTHWRTGVYAGGREIRGKHFRPLVAKGDVNVDGGVTGGALVAYNALADTLIDDEDTVFAIYSPSRARWEPAVTGQVWSQFAVLRSRRD